MPEFARQACSLFPIRLIKTVRLRVSMVERLLKQNEFGPNLKVIVLVRDPRGVMNSRSAMDWCQAPRCADPETACTDLNDDFESAKDLSVRYPGQFHIVRYEDLSFDPFRTADSLFEFAGLHESEGHKRLIEKYLETHTKVTRSELEASGSGQGTDLPAQSFASLSDTVVQNKVSSCSILISSTSHLAYYRINCQ